MAKINKILLSLILVAVVVIAALFSMRASSPAQVQDQPSLQITSPTNDTVVFSGQHLTVSVLVQPVSSFVAVEVFGQKNIGGSTLKAPPFDFDLLIPSNEIGLRKITARGLTDTGNEVKSSIIVDIESPAAINTLVVSPRSIDFDFVGQHSELSVDGNFADNTNLVITTSSLTSYRSSNPNIATVSNKGVVTAVSAGSTDIIVQYGAQSFDILVTVPQSIPGDLNRDGVVNQDDVKILQTQLLLHDAVTVPGDARDLNHDGIINNLDVQELVKLCTSPCNSPPSANAGQDQIVEASSPGGISVTLNGTGSRDPQGDPLTFTWTGPFGIATGASPTVTLTLGTHTITLTVTDPGGLTGTDTVKVTVIPTGAMMVYAKANGDGTPYYRLWNGSAWGSEQKATAVSGATIHFLVLKYARTRDEAVLGTQYSNGDIRVQVWNGTSWSATTLLANHPVGTPRRGFDIAYETNSDRAIVVYRNGNNIKPDYRMWNGTSWSAAQSIKILPTNDEPEWIVMASNPLSSSNEIALILKTDTQTTGLRWTGSAWDNMGDSSVWDRGSGGLNIRSYPQVAYEQQSGRAMFIWGGGTGSPDYSEYYRIWDGSTLTSRTTLRIGGSGTGCPSGCTRAEFIRLVPQPNSNNLMNGVQDGNKKLLTLFWNGSSWSSSTKHDTATENSADRNFDLVFETHSANAGKAWLVWADDATVSRKQWSGSSWGSATTVADDTCLVQLQAQPNSGAVFAVIYEDTSSTADDILEMHLTSGSSTWSSLFTVWTGPTVKCDIMEKVAVASQR